MDRTRDGTTPGPAAHHPLGHTPPDPVPTPEPAPGHSRALPLHDVDLHDIDPREPPPDIPQAMSP
ncbi:hypothetical protein ACFWBB_32235 [Streptomyces sp. NPDC060000]|uniref:hypothetical protein n=1 Tax=Streptomyces sp. NPDC060000 TaxID=3347031 RepID=UPI0036A84186